MLSVSLRPFYLPREFNKVVLNTVYIPPDAHPSTALELIYDVINEQLTSSPDSILLLTGDFNHVTLDASFPLYQHVTCATRKDKTIDLFYSNVKGGYKSAQLAPLGDSDHNMGHDDAEP